MLNPSIINSFIILTQNSINTANNVHICNIKSNNISMSVFIPKMCFHFPFNPKKYHTQLYSLNLYFARKNLIL